MALRHLARSVGVPSLLRAAGPRFSPAAGARHLSFRSFQERIRRMLDVFKKERSNCRGYRSSEGYNPNNHQYSQRYRDAEANQRTNFRSKPRETMSYAMSRHYSILGLDRSRSEPYSDAEIKVAFRRKAMQYHPDHNQNNKEVAEAKFKEVMDSYEAIKSERRNRSC